MQRLWYYLLRTYVWIGLHFYFRNFLVSGKENIPDGKPVIFAANHQNAFLDALIIVATNHRFTHFLARADIFKKKFARVVLHSFNMIPVFRIRDGWESLEKNRDSFEACTEVFNKNGSIVIFPEGNHGGQRRLRPLSRGFTKIAFETLEDNPSSELCIVPVGLNFTDHQKYFSSVKVIYGEPIFVKEFSPVPQGANELRSALADALRKIITHIDPVEEYNAKLSALEKFHPDYLNPQEVNRMLGDLSGTGPSSSGKLHVVWKTLCFLLHGICLVPNIIPLLCWNFIKQKVKDPVFVASMRFCTGIILFPLIYALEIWGISLISTSTLTQAITGFCIVSMPLLKATDVFRN